MLKILELYSGTKSVGKVCDSLGWSSVSVDLEMEADFKCDIMDFDYKQFDKDHFDIVWASPPCTYYSKLQNTWIGRKRKSGLIVTKEWIEDQRKESDKLMIKTFEIIDYFNCKWWFVENPLSCLKDRDVMKDRFYHIVDYCKYCDWGYRKRTCIWTNKEDWMPKVCNKDCENMIQSKHSKDVSKDYGSGTNRLERYRIPPNLIYSLFLE